MNCSWKFTPAQCYLEHAIFESTITRLSRSPSFYFTLLFSCLSIMGCEKTPVAGPVAPPAPNKIYHLVDDFNQACTSDENPFFSCNYSASFPFYESADVPNEIEFCFGMADKKGAAINPAYRSLFNLLSYKDALYTNFMLTGISPSDFDTIKTDYLFQYFAPGDYYETLSPHMNCLFFRSANSNYGIMRINSVVGNGEGVNPLVVTFDVKYVQLAE